MARKEVTYTDAREQEISDAGFAISARHLQSQHPKDRKEVLKLMKSQLEHERQRGAVGHWTYDKKRHTLMHRAYEKEQKDFKTMHPSGVQGTKIEPKAPAKKKK